MFACLGRLGCLFLLLVAGAVAWLTRERWMTRVSGSPSAVPIAWEAVPAGGAREAEAAVSALSRPGGPAYATMSAADLVALMVATATRGLPASLDSVQAAVDGDLVRVRALVPLDAIRGLDALGPLGGLLGRHERIELAGTLAIVRPGLGEYRVASVRVAELALPRAAIPRLLDRLDTRRRPDGLSPDGIALEVPEAIGDVRVARGQVTLYRRAP